VQLRRSGQYFLKNDVLDQLWPKLQQLFALGHEHYINTPNLTLLKNLPISSTTLVVILDGPISFSELHNFFS
jgi:hypothetical protein